MHAYKYILTGLCIRDCGTVLRCPFSAYSVVKLVSNLVRNIISVTYCPSCVRAHITAVNSGAKDIDLIRCMGPDNKVMRLILT